MSMEKKGRKKVEWRGKHGSQSNLSSNTRYHWVDLPVFHHHDDDILAVLSHLFCPSFERPRIILIFSVDYRCPLILVAFYRWRKVGGRGGW